MTVRFGLRAPRVGRRPSAQARRFYEPQKHNLFARGPKLNKKHHPIHSPLLGPARLENRFRFSSLKNNRSPKFAPILRPVSASLRLRCRSATFSSPAAILGISRAPAGRICPLRRAGDGFCVRSSFSRALGNPVKTCQQHFDDFPPKAWRAAVLREGTALGPRGPHVPWTGETYVSLRQPRPVLWPRAGGNLIQTRNTRLNDFLFQQSRAVELRSRALGNLVKTRKRILTISLLRCGARLWLREGTVLFNFAPLVFLLAARQFANCVCIALAGSVGCEQKEPKRLSTDANASSSCRRP